MSRTVTEATSANAGTKRWVYFFGDGHAEGSARMLDLLGGKGAVIAEMVNAGIPVPPGYTITTEACRRFFEAGTSPPPAPLPLGEKASPPVLRGGAGRRRVACYSPLDVCLPT